MTGLVEIMSNQGWQTSQKSKESESMEIALSYELIASMIVFFVIAMFQVLYTVYKQRRLLPMEREFFKVWQTFMLTLFTNHTKHMTLQERTNLLVTIDNAFRKEVRRLIPDPGDRRENA
uniref:Uncharacterized protein n=1 Tax=viral metagenome TaxID=1070528 RepID=A0A2V0RAL3_9ZZZZ